jgi:hypothetical protein
LLAIAALAVLATVGFASAPAAQSFSSASPATVRVDDLVGVWTGQWVADGGAGGGGLEMILVRGAVVLQVTFLDGGQTDTVRHEGRFTRDGAYFGLVGGGVIVLTLEGGRMAGEFVGGPDLPVRRGSLDLVRARKS